MDYITMKLGGTVTKAQYGEPQGRMTIIPPEKTDDGKITIGGLDANVWMTKYGNVYTDCKAEDFMGKLGFAWGDLVTVKFLDKTPDPCRWCLPILCGLRQARRHRGEGRRR